MSDETSQQSKSTDSTEDGESTGFDDQNNSNPGDRPTSTRRTSDSCPVIFSRYIRPRVNFARLPDGSIARISFTEVVSIFQFSDRHRRVSSLLLWGWTAPSFRRITIKDMLTNHHGPDNRVETPPSSPEANESSTRESMVGETVTTASPETNPAQGTPDDESEAARLQQISEETHDVDEDPQ
ncbi:hypothetical protein TREMEDRAFT_65121 [Tremella mesenterica DSM 1558]|uniref:uncharacterized protein n=1 Tax=Tremella mesenterica (strain ATCC 24925 / CBS 8224 / DSM 1558 / NBRC 9311 / NRRL Y-6157 / RJB 2259-6 / UBC 559-6) TaxID=578456 RepID=UPI00032BFE73|nr:uncharacterized protein TREMEDRAFT_65121 [Tremella mesenterica DSM 1558]EIW66727.1 hypothetical protein TREMEDRAFT_65121 [Tremella mesenterica DSM 1558]